MNFVFTIDHLGDVDGYKLPFLDDYKYIRDLFVEHNVSNEKVLDCIKKVKLLDIAIDNLDIIGTEKGNDNVKISEIFQIGKNFGIVYEFQHNVFSTIRHLSLSLYNFGIKSDSITFYSMNTNVAHSNIRTTSAILYKEQFDEILEWLSENIKSDMNMNDNV